MANGRRRNRVKYPYFIGHHPRHQSKRYNALVAVLFLLAIIALLTLILFIK